MSLENVVKRAFGKLNCVPKEQNFGLVQIEIICRRQNKCDSKSEINF